MNKQLIIALVFSTAVATFILSQKIESPKKEELLKEVKIEKIEETKQEEITATQEVAIQDIVEEEHLEVEIEKKKTLAQKLTTTRKKLVAAKESTSLKNKVIETKKSTVSTQDNPKKMHSMVASYAKLTPESKNEDKDGPLSVNASVNAATSLRETSAASDFVSTGLNLGVNYKINNNLTALSGIGFSKDLTKSRDQSISSAFIGISTKLFKVGDFISSSGSLKTYFPVNKDVTDKTSFMGKLSTGASLVTNLAIIGVKNVTLITGVGAAKDFHEFEYTSTGSKNTSVSLSSSLALSYAPTSKLDLSIYGSTKSNWDYDAFNKANTYSIGQSLSYLISKTLSASIGHEVGGNTYGYNGTDLNIDVFNVDDSSIYSSLSYAENF